MKSQVQRQREYRARLKGKNVTCNISNEAFEMLKKECDRTKSTRSKVIESALMYFLNNKEQMKLFKEESEKPEILCKACEGYGCDICNHSGWVKG